jgi:uncharacterized protein
MSQAPQFTNRLAQETSPYLRQHAHNPVDWFPWGEEALARARDLERPIFLSIGYSACHWCHVMEHESFEDPEIGNILNDNFVSIKVDREERPDLDQVYMAFVQRATGHGGWPMSVFLTPEAQPFFGGTYFPPDERYGGQMPSFRRVLLSVIDWWQGRRDEVKKSARVVTHELRNVLRLEPQPGDLDPSLLSRVTEQLARAFDSREGGFGSQPKFPHPTELRLLLRVARRFDDKQALNMARLTLDKMAMGGMYDQLGGGFHRYSTERTWTVPHFEKMLYDNAQLCEIYADAYRTTKKPQYKRVLEQTLAYINREMTSPEGGFYSALDADSQGEEGRFYVWTAKEIDAVLADKSQAELFKQVYGADGPANFESRYYILTLPRPLADRAKDLELTEETLEARLAPLRERLFQVRAKRPRPFLDTKILTAWNGQMIAGLAVAGQALGDKKPIENAARAANFVLQTLRTKNGRLLRSYGAAPGQKGEARLNGYLDDYAFLVHGLLCLHDATGQKRWLDEAKTLTDLMIEFHGDKEHGGFYYTSNDHEKLFARSKDQYDAAQPAGNSVAASNLVRLAAKTGDERYTREAEKTFKALAASLKANPASLTALADALGMYLEGKPAKK